MIRINLLPIRQAQRRQSVQQQLAVGAGVLLLVIVGCVVWYLSLSSSLEEKQTQIRDTQAKIKQLESLVGEVNQYEEKKKELERKLDVIEKLKKGKSGPVRALDDLSQQIPDRVWVEAMNEAGGSVKLKGVALDNEDISLFMKSLQKSKYFTGIVLSYSKKRKGEGGKGDLYEFEITCALNYTA